MKNDALSEIRARLRDSAEMAHIRFRLFLWLAAYAGVLLVCCIGMDRALAFPLLAVAASIVFLPSLLFWLVRMWSIFREIDSYVLCRTELTQPHHACFGLFRFMGVIETERDGRFAVETHAIFQTSGIGLLMEDHLGKTVTVAWNRETGMVVVIG